MSAYEIIADPQEYGIEALMQGLGTQPIDFPEDERRRWAGEIGLFAEKLEGLNTKAQYLRSLLESPDPIQATPASLKTLKLQLFAINDALNASLDIAERLEAEIVRR